MRDRSWEELPQHLTYMKEKGAAAVRSGTCHHNSVGLFSSHRRRAACLLPLASCASAENAAASGCTEQQWMGKASTSEASPKRRRRRRHDGSRTPARRRCRLLGKERLLPSGRAAAQVQGRLGAAYPPSLHAFSRSRQEEAMPLGELHSGINLLTLTLPCFSLLSPTAFSLSPAVFSWLSLFFL